MTHHVFDTKSSSVITTKTETKGPDYKFTFSNKSFNPCKKTGNSSFTRTTQSTVADVISNQLLKAYNKK